MKIIDLLNKIAKKEELPNRIKVYCKWYNKEIIYFLTNTSFSWQDFYMNEDDNTDYCLFENNSINLNDEVEILEEEPYVEVCGRWFTKSEYDNLFRCEEEKKIPEKLSTWFSVETKQSKELNTEYANTNFENMYDKINEICDYLKSKGD